MTLRQLRFSILFILLVGAGLFASSHFIFFKPFAPVYPPSATFRLLQGHPSDKKFVLASAGRHYGTHALGRFFLGEHYRFLWTTPVKVTVLELEKENLRIQKKGGGMQTTSFTLQGENGREYNLRSIDKNPVSVVPAFWHYTQVLSFIRDQISATDPYALPVIARLAHAAGIYQENPRMVFILPGESAFRHYPNVEGFYMLYPDYQPSMEPDKAGAKFVAEYSTGKMLLQRKKKKSGVTLDSLAYLECRLFDLLIGDWDRHPGQWDWHAFSGPKGSVFKPVPKDRDQAFGYYQDGIFPWLFTRNFVVRKISSFGPEFEDLEGFLENGMVLDEILLRGMPEEQFVEAARGLQLKITDQVIEEALKKYPPEVYGRIAPRIRDVLKQRREKLPEAASAFFQILHRDSWPAKKSKSR